MDYLGIDRSSERACFFFFFRAPEIYNPADLLKYLRDLEERRKETSAEKYVDR
jgi:hypothetical protein